MKRLKEIIFYLCIFYVVVILFLFIRQSIVNYKKFNKKYVIEPPKEYQVFIDDSKATLNTYLAKADTIEKKACLKEVEKAIDLSYEKQSLGEVTYKEIIENYYKGSSLDIYLNYSNVIDKCKIKGLNLNPISGNIAIVAQQFSNDIVSHEIELNLKDYLGYMFFVPSVNTILENSKETLRWRVIKNEEAYIKQVLDLVGEEYE